MGTERNYELWLGEAYWPSKSENEIWMVCIIENQESSARGLIITWLHPSGFNHKSWSVYETVSPRIAMAIELHVSLLKGEKILQTSFWGSQKLATPTTPLPTQLAAPLTKLKWVWIFVAIGKFRSDKSME